ncbi:MAG TPA: hypothetical protein VNH11_07145 [Pirellulales bacterium]|nr:hypothetical protein [Pirellulales bacterium]
MNEQATDRLIVDTLYYRRPTPGDSCFVSNLAGMELLRCDSSALERIELVLRGLVAPPSASHVSDEFLGLDYVLGAYAVIGSRYNPGRIVAFMRTMPVVLQAEFVAVLPVFFGGSGDDYDFGVGPTAELVAFVDESRSSGAELLRTAAMRAIPFLTAQAKGRGSAQMLKSV